MSTWWRPTRRRCSSDAAKNRLLGAEWQLKVRSWRCHACSAVSSSEGEGGQTCCVESVSNSDYLHRTFYFWRILCNVVHNSSVWNLVFLMNDVTFHCGLDRPHVFDCSFFPYWMVSAPNQPTPSHVTASTYSVLTTGVNLMLRSSRFWRPFHSHSSLITIDSAIFTSIFCSMLYAALVLPD